MSISNKIADKISKKLDYDQEKSAVIGYGLFAVLQVALSLALVVLFGWIFGVLYQALIVSFVSSILRQYSGGVHATKPSICLIIGTVVTTVIAVIVHLLIDIIDIKYFIIMGIILILFSYYIILKNAPVDSKAKPIKTEKKRKRMKKMSIIVLSGYFVIILTLVILFYSLKNRIYIEYTTCIYLAISWQVFNLTVIGHRVLMKINFIIDKILFRKGGNINEKI